MNSKEQRLDYQKAMKAFEKRYLPYKKELLKSIEKFSPDLADVIIRHGLYEIWEQKTSNLNYREKEIATLSALITQNTVSKEITAHAENCLIQGMKKQEIIEILVLLTLYIGVPKVIQALEPIQQAFLNYDKSQKKIKKHKN